MKTRATLAAGIVLSVWGVTLPAGPAAADQTEHDRVVSADPADWTPNVEGGRVRAIAKVGDTYLAGGNFSRVSEPASGQAYDRHTIFAFDSAGNISETFVPAITGSEVFDILPSGDGRTAYVAGSFRNIDGIGGTARIARIDVTTGAVDRSFRSPGFDNKITDIHLANGRLYVAGWFHRTGGQDRTALTALDPASGADTGTVDLTFADTWNGGVLGVEKIAIAPDGSRLVAIGNFRTVEGQSRPQIVMIDTSGSVASLDSWATARYSTSCSSTFETYLYDVDAAPDGSYFVVVTTGAYSGGVGSGTLCDTAARWEFGPSGPGQQPTWVDYSGGDTLTAVEVTGAAVYVGGHFRWFNNPFAGDKAGPGAVRRMGVAALDPRNGLPLRWNPGRVRGWGIWGFAAMDEGLWFGHDTEAVAGEPRKRIAYLPLDGGSYLPPGNSGTLPGDVYLLNRPGGAVERYQFNGQQVTDHGQVSTSGVDWSRSRGAFMVDGRVYNGWSDGTFTWRPYNGRNFGTPRSINPLGLTDFSTELSNIGTMFFDSRQGRLYFTIAGGSGLYYRYFTPESNVVGAVRFTAPNSAGPDWSRVRGTFLVDELLYYRLDDGTLWSVQWSSGPVPGTETVVSGPSVDGRDWSSQALFLFAG